MVVTVPPYSFPGRGWREAVEEAFSAVFGEDDEGADLYYALETGDLEVLRGAGTLYHGPDAVVNARRCLAGADEPVYAVGDVAAESLLDAGASPALVVTDGKTHRTPYEADIALDERTTYTVRNQAGGITEAAYDAVKTAMDDAPAHLAVEGEEDLLGLAVVDHAEHGTLVYGDPGIDGPEGLRAVDVSEAADAVETILDGC